ncbi:MAG: hypothetical protein IJ326_07745 [Lachnospiraceae bacterium]|nr:hypothetical protein [Lachnospiraceae bacterium]
MLDCEKITEDNCEFYKEIVQAVLVLNELIDESLDVVGIGLETDICYSENICDVIHNSKNVMIWILNKHIKLKSLPKKFKGNIVQGVYILQRE